MKGIGPDKVAIYIRWSTEDQGQGHTLAIQSEACRHYCLSQGWQVHDRFVYVDDGWSGGSLDRPALKRLRADVEAGHVQAVVVYKLDRLSRNIKDIIALVLDEWEGRCAVRSTMEPIDTASDTGKLTFTLLSSFADFERGTIRARTLGGKRKNAEQGRNAGMPYPYGYERGEQKGTYRIVESEAAVVREVFELYLKGMGCKPIAERLNAMGVPNRTGGPGRPRLSPGRWSNTAVLRILKNPTYVGELVYSRTQRNPRRGREGERYCIKNEEAAVIRVASPHVPPIIDRETFEKAQRIRSAKQSPNFGKRAANSPHLLSGLIWCRCGHSVVGRKAAGKNGNYYWCSGRKNKGVDICNSGMVRAEFLDAIVKERLEAVYGRNREEITPEFQKLTADRRKACEELAKNAHAELEQVHAAQQRLVADYGAGVVTGQAYQHLYEALAAKEKELQASIQSLQDQLQGLTEEARLFAERLQAYITFRDSFHTLTDGQKKLLLHQLIHRITVYREQGSKELDLQIDWAGS